ncbi:low temperature requirement protein A [Micromonospora sp. 15K316]|uniref:low temperature requirement protein A n=1 Tax=Micromonospora sp. 15K316 TaxID=2530376 RepID=UPI0010517490|nr:low temperature requirement protein A [Micromonospora sp. 15K316]TDC37848.1 low temperature requirement protein A [Micromonospora sp. 15K316]
MTGARPSELIRDPRSSNRSTLLELLLDVFYIAAFAQLSTQLARDLSWRGLANTVILLLAAWWTWSIIAIATDFFDPRERVIQRVIATGMLGVGLMAAAIPSAFAEHGLLFAGAYVGIHLARGLILVRALRGHFAQLRVKLFLFWFAFSGLLWLAGGLTDPELRRALWAAALVVEYVVAALRFPAPGLGRVPLEQYDRLSPHFGERYQQIAILVIGDLVLASTLNLSILGFTTARVVIFLAAIAAAFLLWQIYVFRAELLVEKSVRRHPRRAVRLAPYVYVVLVAGVIATTAGVDLALAEPFASTHGGLVALVVGGSFLFLLGRVIFEYELLGRLSRSRIGWLALMIAVLPALKLLAPVFVVIINAGILFGVTRTDAWRGRRNAAA